MSVVLGDRTADAVDDALTSLCELCASPYDLRDGWQSLCPACCAVIDDHEAGRHDERPLPACQVCDCADGQWAATA